METGKVRELNSRVECGRRLCYFKFPLNSTQLGLDWCPMLSSVRLFNWELTNGMDCEEETQFKYGNDK